uniref:Uncharacterized protein n=1 Tax=Steinernema glaseri TaxID=37863 RepID=A0A1I8AGU7_9BILA
MLVSLKLNELEHEPGLELELDARARIARLVLDSFPSLVACTHESYKDQFTNMEENLIATKTFSTSAGPTHDLPRQQAL